MFSRFGSGEEKGRPFVNQTLGPDTASVPMQDPLHCGQPDPCSFERFGLVKALKDAKKFIDVFHIKTYAVVSYEDDYLSVVSVGAPNLDFGLWA